MNWMPTLVAIEYICVCGCQGVEYYKLSVGGSVCNTDFECAGTYDMDGDVFMVQSKWFS